ncbi:MAG: DUF2283 domain-containing protein [Candidatus Micrarchaeota archaeon]
MAQLIYDKENDALSVDLSSKKAAVSLEISPRFIIDLTASNQPTGIEILDASEVLSTLFGTRIKKSDLHKLHCTFNKEAIRHKEELYATFQLGQRQAKVLIPTNYQSPVTLSV